MKKTNREEKMIHENKANIGDTIRAYDFQPREGVGHYFIEGKVIEKGNCDNKYYKCYKIALTRKIANGKDVTPKVEDNIWYVPFEIYYDEHENRVTKIEEKK
tara:strand:- start:2100 stop:2405 length:306 start_codon:yes stop_codon:yes gene_type:complete